MGPRLSIVLYSLFATLSLIVKAEVSKAMATISTDSGNPRSTEGGFVTLRDGSLLYTCSPVSETATGDHSTGHLASCLLAIRETTWLRNDPPVFPHERKQNDMSVSLFCPTGWRSAVFLCGDELVAGLPDGDKF